MTKALPNKTVSVSEFAKLAGVSNQAIYKQIPTRLATYSTKVGNRWMIDISALDEVYNNDELTTNEQPVDNQQQPTEQPSEITQAYIQTLKDQLAAKDKQIESLLQKLEHEQELRMAEVQAVLLSAPEPKRKWWQRKKETV